MLGDLSEAVIADGENLCHECPLCLCLVLLRTGKIQDSLDSDFALSTGVRRKDEMVRGSPNERVSCPQSRVFFLPILLAICGVVLNHVSNPHAE